MKLLALVLTYVLTLTSLVAGCREVGQTCGVNVYCCGEDTGETICQAGMCIRAAGESNQAEASAHLRGAIEAVKFITEDEDEECQCREAGETCEKGPRFCGGRCSQGGPLGCWSGICQPCR